MPDRRDTAHAPIVPCPARRRGEHLTTGDIAELTGFGTDYIRNEMDEGRLHGLILEQPGERTLYRCSKKQFEEWIALKNRKPSLRRAPPVAAR